MDRLYVVRDTAGTRPTRLIEAANPAQAIRYCSSHLAAEAASARDVADLMATGVKVERPPKQSRLDDIANVELRG